MKIDLKTYETMNGTLKPFALSKWYITVESQTGYGNVYRPALYVFE